MMFPPNKDKNKLKTRQITSFPLNYKHFILHTIAENNIYTAGYLRYDYPVRFKLTSSKIALFNLWGTFYLTKTKILSELLLNILSYNLINTIVYKITLF